MFMTNARTSSDQFRCTKFWRQSTLGNNGALKLEIEGPRDGGIIGNIYYTSHLKK